MRALVGLISKCLLCMPPATLLPVVSSIIKIVLRLWRRVIIGDPTSDVTIFTWGISFTGLTYIGPKLPSNLDIILCNNSLVFHLHGGYFTPSFCLTNPPNLMRYLHMSVNSSEIKDSYTVNKLSSLRSKMQALRQQSESVRILRERIASGDDMQTPKFPQSSLNRLLQPRKVTREKRAEIMRIRKELEVARFRAKLLEQERVRKMGELRALNQLHSSIKEENQDHGSDLMERYRELNRDVEKLHEWRQNHVEKRDTFIQTTSQLAHRRRQLISELCLIYPIQQERDGKFMINNVHLPDSEELESSNDTQVAVALGSVAHTTQMIASFLNVPTRYPIIHYGSRSKIIDHITNNLPERQFPLFSRGKDKLQFHYAVYLLNKNIAQLRWYCGLPTMDLRATLLNLSSLINIKQSQPFDSSKRTFSGSSLDTETGSSKHNMPLTPPIQKVMFEKCHRSSRSISQLKCVRSSLGSSLDQGLDKTALSLVLSNQSKRICKSEESAIDDKTLTLPEGRSSNSSDETLNGTIFNNTKVANASCYAEIDATLINNFIEITIPISVSKPKNTSENVENTVNTRQRSSNSISSCEMALSSSQIDGEDSLNDNPVKTNDSNESVFSADERLESPRDHEGAVTNDSKSSYAISSDALQRNQHPTNSDLSLGNCSENFCDNSEVATNSNPLVSSSKEHSYDRVSQEKMSSSSNSEDCFTSKKVPGRKIYDPELRRDRGESQLSQQDWLYGDHAKSFEESSLFFKYDEILNHGSLLNQLPYHVVNEEKEKFRDLQASSEYLNSMKRSSDNVFARTEALASKNTSFKVMKPRP
ncbi:UV radiation resistance-associated gene protein isoform X2 [Orussus abietinus]|uniref:UV radiation resistance-associated gene protein isoform X2 n=1 Tax=Orussus abietinus TaxID=222816 RepID=UPI0006257258|nr:UV radiation resistance-associated gene protein isoform X2 [Orussus abietinus]